MNRRLNLGVYKGEMRQDIFQGLQYIKLSWIVTNWCMKVIEERIKSKFICKNGINAYFDDLKCLHREYWPHWWSAVVARWLISRKMAARQKCYWIGETFFFFFFKHLQYSKYYGSSCKKLSSRRHTCHILCAS